MLRASQFGYWGDAKARAAGRTSRTAKILTAIARLQQAAASTAAPVKPELGEAAAPGLEASERYDGALLGKILDEPPLVWHQ